MVKGITYILANDSTFQTTATQNAAGTKYKVYPVVAPATEHGPYSVVRQVSHIGQQCKIGHPTTFDDVYSVTSFHKNYEDAVTLDNAVIDALKEKKGTYNGVDFVQIRHQNSLDDEFDAERELFARTSLFTAVVNT